MAGAALDILNDDLATFNARGPAFVTFGEVMVRDTPADNERLERTRLVNLSMAGSELTLAMALQPPGRPVRFITRVPDNPYGWALRDLARAQGLDTSHFVWAPRAELIGRFLYELGRTPRRESAGTSACTRRPVSLGAGMVDWPAALADCRLLHTSGITFGLARHSGYERNYLPGGAQGGAGGRPPAAWSAWTITIARRSGARRRRSRR